MLPRRWYGAALLAAALVMGTVYGQRPDVRVAPVPPPVVWATAADAPLHGVVPTLPPVVTPPPTPDKGPPTARVIAASRPAESAPPPLLPFANDGLQPGVLPPAPPKELVPIQTVGFPPNPAPVPSDLEAAAEKKRVTAPVQPQPTAPATVAVLSLEVVGPPTVTQGQPLVYEIVVRNPGKVAVGNVRVEDGMIGGSRFLQSEPAADMQNDRAVWSLGTLEVGAERRIKVKIQPGEAGDVGVQPTVSYGAPALRARVVRPALIVAQVAPETAERGQNVPIEIRVTNNSSEPMQHVVLRAQIPPGLQFLQGNVVEAEVGTLAANETKAVRLDAQAVQLGRVVNLVTARAPGGLTARCEAAVLVQEPGLSARLDGSRQATVGGELNLRVEVANAGSKPARGVGLLLTLPDGIEPLSASKGGAVDPTNRHVVAWPVGALGNGERQTVSLKAKARVAGDWLCQATVRAEGLADSKTTATLHIEAAPSLWLEIAGRNDAIDTGAETVYEMRVLNQGGVPCPGVRLVAVVPDGLQVMHAEGPTAAVIHQQQVQFDPLPELPGRTEGLYRLRVRGQRAGDFRLRVRVEADPLENPLVQEANLRVNGNIRDVLKPVPGTANPGPPR